MEREDFMRCALALAREAGAAGETPVGAVVVDASGAVVGRGRNSTEERDATCHAEIEALRDAAGNLGRWRLTGCALYVTMEPCPMCAGAAMNSRISELVYGARDTRAGACGGVMNIFVEGFSPGPKIYGGVLEEECRRLLSDFFREKR